MTPAVTQRDVVREDGSRAADDVVVEEPLEIRLHGDTLAVTMRTPGDDRHLVAGFLLGEGLIRSLDDLSAIAPCGRPGDAGYGNVVDVTASPGVDVDPEKRVKRGTLSSAACGVCGRATIDDLIARMSRLPDGPTVARDVIATSTARLRERQPAFAKTGGLHAAAALAADGTVLASAEDIGRHNAVDKVAGALLYAKARAAVLVVSGRTSFEIVQKALASRIPIVAGVGAVSSLAIDLAVETNLTVAGFVRDGRISVYAHPERIR